MFHYETVKILHHHGDDDWVPMAEEPEHDSAAHDPERAWLKGARIFRCKTCAEQIAIADPAASNLLLDRLFAPVDPGPPEPLKTPKPPKDEEA